MVKVRKRCEILLGNSSWPYVQRCPESCVAIILWGTGPLISFKDYLICQKHIDELNKYFVEGEDYALSLTDPTMDKEVS